MKYNDNESELLYLVSEENEDAKEQFYKQYKGKIEIKAKKYSTIIRNCGIEINDLIQEGMIGLSEALKNYKDQKNTKFSTFANICIDRKMLSYIRSITSDKNKFLNTSISMDTATNTNGRSLLELIEDDSKVNPEEIYIDNENYKELIKNIDKLLSKTEKDVFLLRSKGFSYQEISMLLEITPKAAERAIYRIKEKLEKLNKNID